MSSEDVENQRTSIGQRASGDILKILAACHSTQRASPFNRQKRNIIMKLFSAILTARVAAS